MSNAARPTNGPDEAYRQLCEATTQGGSVLDDSERLATAVRNHAGRQDRLGSLRPRRHNALRTKTANRSWKRSTRFALLIALPDAHASLKVVAALAQHITHVA